MIMNAGLCSFFVVCCMSYKNTAALSPVGTLSIYITSLSWLMVTLSDFFYDFKYGFCSNKFFFF